MEKVKNVIYKMKGMVMMSLYNDIELQYDCWQERPRILSDSFKELFRRLYMFSNWTEYNIKESVLWSDKNVKQNTIF